MKARKRRKGQKRLEGEFDGYDNWDIVDIDEHKPSDYWALKEREEEYCKEYGYC